MIDLIEQFKQEYIYNVDKSIQKELLHIDKTSRITTNDSKQKTKNSISNSISSDTNITNQTVVQTRPLSSKQTSDKNFINNSKTPQKTNSQISCTKLFTTQTKPKKGFDYVMNYYQNIIHKQESMKNIKNNTNISQQKNKTKKTIKTIKNKFVSNNFFYTKNQVIKYAQCENKDDIAKVEFKKNNLSNRTSLNCINKNLRNSCSKIQGIRIKNFKNIIKNSEQNSTHKCKSDRTEQSHRRENIL